MQDALKDLQNEFKELEDEFKASVAAVETQDATGFHHTTMPLAYVSCGSEPLVIRLLPVCLAV